MDIAWSITQVRDNEQLVAGLNEMLAASRADLLASEQQVSSLKVRVEDLEFNVKSSEDLLQEKLSALGQLQEDSAVLNESILELKEKVASAEADKARVAAENISLQTLVSCLL